MLAEGDNDVLVVGECIFRPRHAGNPTQRVDLVPDARNPEKAEAPSGCSRCGRSCDYPPTFRPKPVGVSFLSTPARRPDPVAPCGADAIPFRGTSRSYFLGPFRIPSRPREAGCRRFGCPLPSTLEKVSDAATNCHSDD